MTRNEIDICRQARGSQVDRASQSGVYAVEIFEAAEQHPIKALGSFARGERVRESFRHSNPRCLGDMHEDGRQGWGIRLNPYYPISMRV